MKIRESYNQFISPCKALPKASRFAKRYRRCTFIPLENDTGFSRSSAKVNLEFR